MARWALLVCAGIVIVMVATVAAMWWPEDDRTVDEAEAGAEAVELDCDADGYPCSWHDADPEVLSRSMELLRAARVMFDNGDSLDDIAEALESDDDVVDLSVSSAELAFRLDGGLPVSLMTPLADKLPGDDEASFLGPQPASVQLAAFEPAGDPGEGNDQDGERAIVIEPYGPMGPSWSSSSFVASLRSSDQFAAVDHISGPDLTFDVMMGLDSYDVLHISSHGSSQGFIGQHAAPSFDFEEDGSGASLKDGVEIPDGVSMTDTGGDWRFGYGADFFRTYYGGGLTDALIFADWCQSAKGGYLDVMAGRGSTTLGWSETVSETFAGMAASRLWKLMVEDGIDAGVAMEQLGDEGLTSTRGGRLVDRLSNDLRNQLACGAEQCEIDDQVRLLKLGGDLRARDVVTTYQGDEDRITAGTEFEWSGEAGDGEHDFLDELAIRVEGVEQGREEEVRIELYLDGERFDEDLTLADAEQESSGPLWGDWIVRERDLEMPFDVTSDRIGEPLSWEVRVLDADPGHSAHVVEPVYLEGPRVSVLHPETLHRLSDGEVLEILGWVGDGEADEVEIALEVTNVDPEDVDDYRVERTVLGPPMAFPDDVEYALADFEEVDDETYRLRETIALDDDVTDDNDELTIDAELYAEEEQSAHEVTVRLDGARIGEACSVDVAWSGTYSDAPGSNGDYQVYDTAGSKRGVFDPSDDEQDVEIYLGFPGGHLGEVMMLLGKGGMVTLSLGDMVGSGFAAPGETGTFEASASAHVLSEAEPSGFNDDNLEMFDGEAIIDLAHHETSELDSDLFGEGVPDEVTESVAGSFRARLDQTTSGSHGSIEVTGTFSVDPSCDPVKVMEEWGERWLES